MSSFALALALSCGLNLQATLGHAPNYTTLSTVGRALVDKDPDLIVATLIVGAIESGLQPNVARGAAGEIGMFQILPSNFAWLAKRCDVTGNPRREAVNARLAYCYLEYLHELSGGDLDATIAAYNAGPSVIEKLQRHRPIPGGTANYLVKFNRLRKGTQACSK
jgi:hypothetical protein